MSGTIHEMLQDRMPEVARGSATWDAADLAHLASCADCGAEWELVRTAIGVGAHIEREFDAVATAQVVTGRLRSHRSIHRRPAVRVLAGLAAAAAIAFVHLGPGPEQVQTAVPVAEGRLFPELDSLSTEELTVIEDGLDTPLAETPLGDPQTFEDLDSTQLTRVLRALEG